MTDAATTRHLACAALRMAPEALHWPAQPYGRDVPMEAERDWATLLEPVTAVRRVHAAFRHGHTPPCMSAKERIGDEGLFEASVWQHRSDTSRHEGGYP